MVRLISNVANTQIPIGTVDVPTRVLRICVYTGLSSEMSEVLSANFAGNI